MMATHIEDICQGEAQAIEEMELDEQYDQKNNFHITGINFGLTTQNIMKYLVEIYNCVKKIAMLKKKMKNDPLNARKHEKAIWSLYQKVTDNKDAYYLEKMNSVPRVRNAYVTFRSMEGKQRALTAWETPNAVRIFAEYICCM